MGGAQTDGKRRLPGAMRTGGSVIDTQLVQEIYHRHGAALLLYGRQWCAQAEDALQEALLELARQPHPPVEPLAWMFRAVKFRALNLQRAERRRLRHQRLAASERKAWFESESSSEVDSQALQDALQSLTALDREIVIARVWGGLGLEQIAELTERSRSTVHRRYQAALKSLRSQLSTLDCPLESR